MPGPTHSQVTESRLVRTLAFVHLAYLLALPFMGLVRLHHEGMLTESLLPGWLPIVVYVTVLAQWYRIHPRPLRALLLVLAVPGQVGMIAWLTDGDFASFLYEAAVVEVGGILVALALGMAIARPNGLAAALTVSLVALGWLPYAMLLVGEFPGWPFLAKVLFVTSVGKATSEMVAMVVAKGKAFRATGKAQEVELVHGDDSGAAAAHATSEMAIHPLQGRSGATKWLVLLGAGFVVLTIVAALVFGVEDHLL